MAKKGNQGSQAREGKKVGGDEHPTFAWGGDKEAPGSRISGRLLSIEEVKTRFGVRTRLSFLTNDPLTCETQNDGEIVVVDAGKTVGMWLPERWATSMRPMLNSNFCVYRDIEGTQIRYDVRAL